VGGIGLAALGRPRRDAVLALLNPFAASRFGNQRLIERRLAVEVEPVEAFGVWRPRLQDAEMA
jgi:hypothetical protein